MNYIPLYVKSDYSLLSSLITIDDLIKKCQDLNITTIALTDNNVMSGTIEFYNKCLASNIKPIIGLELDYLDSKLLLYAKNYQGYQNLIKLTTIKSERDITKDDLVNYNSNVICIIPYKYQKLYSDFKLNYVDIFLGYNSTSQKEELLKTSSNLIFINETLYLEENESIYLQYANLIRDGKKVQELSTYKYIDNHLLSPQSIDFNDAKSTNISNLFNLKFDKKEDCMPVYQTEGNLSPSAYLIELSKKGLSKRLNNKIPKTYADRLFYELDIITTKNFSNYFLIVADYVKYAKKNNILVGPGRGSAASSLVSYSLGITDIDPIKYNLLFERFLNPERISMPDIDIDFEDEKRDDVISYVTNKYGIKKVAGIITYGTLGSKLVIRDVARLFDLPVKLVDRINNQLPFMGQSSLQEMYKENKKLKEIIDSSVDLKSMYKVAMHLENKKRHTSTHAAGIIMCNNDLDEIVPLVKSNDNYIVAYTMDYLEELGLLKMDFLGLKNLTIIKNILNDIKTNDKLTINLNDIPFDDSKTIAVFNNVNTVGIFQFESDGMKNFLQKLKINNFEEIVAAIALFRPGPMDNINLYIQNRNNPSKVNYVHHDLKPILESTYGVIIYQEQIMQIANIMADYTLGEADVLRRAMSKKKKEVMANEQQRFIERALQKGYDQETADKVFALILKFADYGFNRAHSVSYSVISYQMAYLKSHYSLYFMTQLLNNALGSEQKTKEYIQEIKQYKLIVAPPDVNASDLKYKVINNTIIYSLTALKNVGYVAAKEITEERTKGRYKDFYDFIARLNNRNVNKKVIESLIDAGAFNSFGFNKNTLYHNLDAALNYGELIKDLKEEYVEKPMMDVVNDFDKDTLMKKENNVFGFYLNGSPVEKYKDNDIGTNNIQNYFDKKIDIYLHIDYLKKIKTKKNETMCLINGSDEYKTIDLVMFPDVYKDYDNLAVNNIIKATGRVEKRLAKYQIIVSSVEILE